MPCIYPPKFVPGLRQRVLGCTMVMCPDLSAEKEQRGQPTCRRRNTTRDIGPAGALARKRRGLVGVVGG